MAKITSVGLAGVGGLMSAGQWGTAAVVWAYTEPQQGARTDANLDEKSPKLTLEAFASLGIRGLSTRNSVRKYRRAWERAIDEGWA